MKKLVVVSIFVLTMASALCAQQGTAPSIIPYPGVPGGRCSPAQVAVNSSNGDLYDCVAGIWTVVGHSGGGATIAHTSNVIKGDGAGNGVASSIVDDGTNPTQAPDGLSSMTNGFYLQIVNANPGTVLNKTVCRDSSGHAVTCGTSATAGVAGVANQGAGNSGSVQVCNTQCTPLYDNQTVIGHYAIPSVSVAGELHDVGTTETAGVQNFIVDAANSGVGTTALTSIFTPDQISGGNNGGGTAGKGTSVQINDVLSHAIADFKDSATVTWGVSNSGNKTTVTATAAGGITSVAVPTDVFSGTPCSGPTCTFAFNAQQAGFVWRIASQTFQTPLRVQTPATPGITASGTTVAKSFVSATTQHNAIVALVINNAGGAQTGLTIADTQGNTYTRAAFNDDNHAAVIFVACDIAGGADTVTATWSGSATGLKIIIAEYSNLQTASCVDATSAQLTGLVGTLVPFLPVTTTVSNDLILGGAMSTGAVPTYTASGGFTILSQDNSGSFGIALEDGTASTPGSYVPVMSSSAGATATALVVTLKALATPGSLTPFFGATTFDMDTIAKYPGLSGISPSHTTGDTQIDLHVGSPINVSGRTTAYAGNDAASTLYTVPSLSVSGEAFHCSVYVSCNTTVATATIIPALLFTDEQGTAETLTGTTATCTTAGTNDVSSQSWPIRAKSASTIFVKTTLANSPHYDIHAVCEIASNQ